MKIAVHLLHLGIAVALVLSPAPSAVARQHLHPPSGSADGAAHAAPHCGAVAGNAHIAADGAHTASDKNCCCGGAACDDGCVHNVSLVASRIPAAHPRFAFLRLPAHSTVEFLTAPETHPPNDAQA